MSVLQDPNCILNQVLQKTKPISRLQAAQVLGEAYDVTFGIFNHLKQAQLEASTTSIENKRPLASVALHPAEAWAGEKTNLDVVLRGFAENQVGDIFKMSLTEFLELPVEYAERVMRISKSILTRKNNQQDAQAAAMAAEAANRRT